MRGGLALVVERGLTRPAPYPADTKAKGWRFELDLEKVEASDTWLRARTGALRGALLLLWAKSWQQVPCGSLPSDDELVSLLIDMPAATFTKHRAVLMRGWWLADDGRLYHDTIVTRVLAMLDKRATDAERAARNRAKRADNRASPPEVMPASRVTHAGLQSEFDTKHQAPEVNTNTPQPPKGLADRFPEFWATWPKSNRKGGKAECEKVWVRNGLDSQADTILAHVKTLAESNDWTKNGGEFIPAPVVYLRGKRWDGAEVSEHTESTFAGGV